MLSSQVHCGTTALSVALSGLFLHSTYYDIICFYWFITCLYPLGCQCPEGGTLLSDPALLCQCLEHLELALHEYLQIG